MGLNCLTGLFLHLSVIVWVRQGNTGAAHAFMRRWEENWLIRSVIGLFPSPKPLPVELVVCPGFGIRTNGHTWDPWLLWVGLRKKGAVWRMQSMRHRRKTWPWEAGYWSSPLIVCGAAARYLPLWASYMCVCVCVKAQKIEGMTNWNIQKLNIFSCG